MMIIVIIIKSINPSLCKPTPFTSAKVRSYITPSKIKSAGLSFKLSEENLRVSLGW